MGTCSVCGNWAGLSKHKCPVCASKEASAEANRRDARNRYAAFLLDSTRNGTLVALPRKVRLPVNLNRWETCFYCTGMTLYQLAAASYARSVSTDPAADWVGWRHGQAIAKYDAGILAVTDGRLIFAGERSTFNIYLDEIVALRRQPHSEGHLLGVSACTFPKPLFFGYVEYTAGRIDPVGDLFNTALESILRLLLQRRTRAA